MRIVALLGLILISVPSMVFMISPSWREVEELLDDEKARVWLVVLYIIGIILLACLGFFKHQVETQSQ